MKFHVAIRSDGCAKRTVDMNILEVPRTRAGGPFENLRSISFDRDAEPVKPELQTRTLCLDDGLFTAPQPEKCILTIAFAQPEKIGSLPVMQPIRRDDCGVNSPGCALNIDTNSSI